MLQATDVWFGYDNTKPVLRGVSVAVPRAGIIGILGPNGSGKTTLLRLLAGTRHPQRGAVTLDGAPLTRFSRAGLARRMAVVPQETQLAFDYTVGEVAMMGRYPHLGPFEIEGPADLSVVDETLKSTGTLHLKDRLFATLSGGEKQRVVIAAALAQIFREDVSFRLKAETTGGQAETTGGQAETTGGRGGSRSFRLQAESGQAESGQAESETGYLLLDEPTASLDLGYQLEVASLLRQLHEERRVAIVISTHDLGLAGTLCDRLMLIRDGAVVAEGPTDEVLTPAHVREVYGVDAEIIRHSSGQRVVVPLRRSAERERG
jgi:iron complex transport system ATP-binding protein